VWEALYQQRPSPASGGTFQRGWFRYYEIEGDGYRLIYHADQEKLAEQREEREQKAAEDRYAEPELKGVQGVERTPGSSRRVSPHDCQIIPTLDCASSDKEDADFTCLQIWAVTPAWEMLLIDRWLERAQTPDVVAKVAEILRGYNLAEIYVEKNGLGLGIVQTLRRLGFIVKGLHAHTNKVLRSQIAQLRAQAGYVYLPLGAEMTEEFLKEVETFPRGANDDQVDAFSWASIVVQKLGGPVMTAVDHAAAAKAEAAIRAMEQQADDANTPGARIQSVDTATEADDPELREWLAGSDG
jgi:predicted phage terminase large subunit-like protein